MIILAQPFTRLRYNTKLISVNIGNDSRYRSKSSVMHKFISPLTSIQQFEGIVNGIVHNYTVNTPFDINRSKI